MSHFNPTLPPVAVVMFHGNINISGRNGNNLEATRDGCELFWHAPSGGVIVAWGGQQHYVPAVSVMSVTFVGDVLAQAEERAEERAEKGAPEPSAQPHAEPASPNLADKVLEEFSEGKDATPQPKPKRK